MTHPRMVSGRRTPPTMLIIKQMVANYAAGLTAQHRKTQHVSVTAQATQWRRKRPKVSHTAQSTQGFSIVKGEEKVPWSSPFTIRDLTDLLPNSLWRNRQQKTEEDHLPWKCCQECPHKVEIGNEDDSCTYYSVQSANLHQIYVQVSRSVGLNQMVFFRPSLWFSDEWRQRRPVWQNRERDFQLETAPFSWHKRMKSPKQSSTLILFALFLSLLSLNCLFHT